MLFLKKSLKKIDSTPAMILLALAWKFFFFFFFYISNQPKKLIACIYFAEYCTARALPTVLSSDYLRTVGSKLLPGIDIMWTGGHVCSSVQYPVMFAATSLLLKLIPPW